MSSTDPLPAWVPPAARGVYADLLESGVYSAPRMAAAFESLFREEELGDVWARLAAPWDELNEFGYRNYWLYVIGSIVDCVVCAPERGVRATRNVRSMKGEVLENQKDADRLLREASNTALKLRDLLEQIDSLGAVTPDEVYDSRAWINAALAADGMAKATCGRAFANFERSLSSRARSCFPSPAAMLAALAESIGRHPNHRIIFQDIAWLKVSHSTWKDYVRELRDCFTECERMYGSAPSLREVDWFALLRALINPRLTRGAVAKGLKEL